MKDAGEWYRAYAERVAGDHGRYNEALVERAGADLVPILMAHFLVSGVTMDRDAPARRTRAPHGRRLRGHAAGDPRRPAVRGDGPHPCAAEGAGRARSPPSTPARCSRSTSARPASRSASSSWTPNRDGSRSPETHPAAERPPPRPRAPDTWDAIEARADELADAFLDLTVKTSGDRHDARRARARDLPVPREGPRTATGGGSIASGWRRITARWEELYAEYYRREHRRGRRRTTCSRSSATCSRRRPMRPLELTLEGFRSYRERRHVRLARSAARRHRRADRLGEVLDPRRGLVRAVREDPRRGGRHEVADPPAVRPVHVELRFEVDGQVWRAVRSLATQGRVRTPARAAGRRLARRRRSWRW